MKIWRLSARDRSRLENTARTEIARVIPKRGAQSTSARSDVWVSGCLSSAAGPGPPPNITRNDWRAQAKAPVEDIRDESTASAALKIQVKLAEALSRASPNEARALERNPRPDKTRTAVCLELHGGPLRPRRSARGDAPNDSRGAAKGIHPDYYLSDANALAFDQPLLRRRRAPGR